MELFEIVIILLFFLLPVLEGIFKKRRKQRGEGGSPGAGGRPDGGGEVETAEDILPEELWEELTGAPAAGRSSTVERETPDFETAESGRLEPTGTDEREWGAPAAGEADGSEGEWISEAPSGEGGAEELDTAAAEREALRRELAAGRRRPGTGRSRAGELQRVRPGRLARRGAAPTEGTHPLLGETDPEALRRAVVWREVLGRPVALRRSDPPARRSSS